MDLQRRIPPLSIEEMTERFMDDTSLSHYDAEQMAVEMHANAMTDIYRLARIGEKLSQYESITTRQKGMVRFLIGLLAEGVPTGEAIVRLVHLFCLLPFNPCAEGPFEAVQNPYILR